MPSEIAGLERIHAFRAMTVAKMPQKIVIFFTSRGFGGGLLLGK
jgi:hypothetical protein